MKENLGRVLALAGLFAVVGFALAGCTLSGVSLREEGIARTEILSSRDPGVSIERAELYQDDGELVVRGAAYKNGPRFRTYEGHIDVAVIDPDRQTITWGAADYRHVPSRHRYSLFEVRLPVVAEEGTLVRLLFHPVNGTGAKHLAAIERLKTGDRHVHP